MTYCRLIAIGLILLLVLVPGCGGDSPVAKPSSDAAVVHADIGAAEPWVSKPRSEWPQLVLTNDAEFNGHSSLQGASGFLIEAPNDQVFATTAAHLIGSAGGVEPEIPVNQLTSKIREWRMHPRTVQDDFVEIESLGVQGLGDESLDWLILSIRDAAKLPAYPLKIRREPVRVGETVFLVGCPYAERDCKQNVYTGKVTERAFGDRFRYDIDPPVDIRGFSGAPIIDQKGHVVGLMTVWFHAQMSGDDYLEAGGEDIGSIYHMLPNAD